jgi:soluble lytic murein transglycosylase-like protein
VVEPTPSRLWQGFTPSVLAWEPLITRWSDHYRLDPNMAAVVMQIESCGDPLAVSHAGARGLFQVMPFHFAAGENPLDPETNAMRGLGFLAEVLGKAGGETGRAFAAYNGGWGGTSGSRETWKAETQRYHRWATGIYAELETGPESTTLAHWLNAGGASLCHQAESRLGK